VTTVGLDLADDAAEEPAQGPVARIGSIVKRMLARLGALYRWGAPRPN